MRRFVVIGSGPSLGRMDAERAADAHNVEAIIVVNTAYQMLPCADYLYACDIAWWDHHFGRARDAFRVRRMFTGRMDVAEHYGIRSIETRDHGSGLQAIRLAQHLGATDVALLGFDWCAEIDGRKHFHVDHPAPMNNSLAFQRYARPNYGDLKIVNCSRRTALDWYPKMSLGEWLLE